MIVYEELVGAHGYRDPVTKILFRGTFGKIGVMDLRWVNHADVTAKSDDERTTRLRRTQERFAAR